MVPEAKLTNNGSGRFKPAAFIGFILDAIVIQSKIADRFRRTSSQGRPTNLTRRVFTTGSREKTTLGSFAGWLKIPTQPKFFRSVDTLLSSSLTLCAWHSGCATRIGVGAADIRRIPRCAECLAL
jgi:hypothetical protein